MKLFSQAMLFKSPLDTICETSVGYGGVEEGVEARDGERREHSAVYQSGCRKKRHCNMQHLQRLSLLCLGLPHLSLKTLQIRTLMFNGRPSAAFTAEIWIELQKRCCH